MNYFLGGILSICRLYALFSKIALCTHNLVLADLFTSANLASTTTEAFKSLPWQAKISMAMALRVP